MKMHRSHTTLVPMLLFSAYCGSHMTDLNIAHSADCLFCISIDPIRPCQAFITASDLASAILSMLSLVKITVHTCKRP